MNKPLDPLDLTPYQLRMLVHGLQLLTEQREAYAREFPDDPDGKRELAEAWDLQARMGL